ncbi:TetR/AcrR family transcriptional regulator [Actinomycetospora chiangmaiensis]|uniref:TetR/AcrR family transcriptional regulator n=1 Tax=Actinomycetospora chiangmaiensis TaxID=402650 RepID=UPI00037D5B07|nr:TetR/AcrR family transcriptional regulator [Actinomycetospora chiangmaiensis]
MTSPPGRRERKKAATRAAIADAALALFLERGFDAVTVKEVADAADVSLTTLFNHFPSKESLVFDEEAEREARLLGAVRGRPDDVDVLTALQRFARSAADRRAEPGYEGFVAMVGAAPSLLAYSRRMWEGYESSLAAAVADDAGLEPADPRARALAHVVVATIGSDPPQVDAVFDLLRHGWTV